MPTKISSLLQGFINPKYIVNNTKADKDLCQTFIQAGLERVQYDRNGLNGISGLEQTFGFGLNTNPTTNFKLRQNGGIDQINFSLVA